MRTSRVVACWLTLALSACSISPTIGEDGAPGSVGRAQGFWVPDLTGARSTGQRFQIVKVIAPAPGARCSSSFGTEAPWVDRDRVANADREVILRIKSDTKSPTLTCKKDGQTWKRKMPRQVIRKAEDQIVRYADGRTHTYKRRALYAFPPIFHVPGPDAGAQARWDEWRAEQCDKPTDTDIRYICATGIETVMAADLGEQR